MYKDERIILNKELSLSDLIPLKKIMGSPTMSVSPVILLLCYTIWVSFLVFCPTLVSWISKKLRVTSPLLIFLAGRGGSHWVLVNLSFILGPRSNSIKCKWGIVGVTYKLLRGLDILIHLSLTGSELISIPLLYRESFT